MLPPVVVIGNTSQANAAALTGQRGQITTGSTVLPSAISVIDSEEVSTINMSRDISNVFRRVPGVVANSIQGDTGNGFRMRGFAT